MKIHTVIISEESSTIEVLKRYTEDSEGFSFLAGTSDFSKAYNAIKELDKSLVIIDISTYQEQGLNFVSKIAGELPQSRIITVSDKPDINLVIRTMRVGACNFVSIPVIKEKFLDILDKIYCDMTGAASKKSACRVVSVYSNKGGIGKTSVAVNLALELAKITKENTALIDLNFQSGDITTFLDLKPVYNISYMLENLDKINDDFLLSTLEKYKDVPLYVLADSPRFNQKENVSIKDIEVLFEKLKNTFSYIVVDTSGGFDKKALKPLELSDIVLLVTIVNLPALRNCQKCLEFFEAEGFAKNKIQILVNRFMENDEISAKDVEDVLGKKLYWKIPNNYFTMMSAINKGVSVSEINPDSNVALSYKNLALMLSDSLYRGNFDD